MMKKGQAAMEFLMTYGWAIIVVLAAIAALAYFGVLSPDRILPERTTFTAPLANVDKASIDVTAGTVAIALSNNAGYSITLPGTGLTATDDCATPTWTSVTMVNGTAYATTDPIPNGETFVVTITCGGGITAGRFKTDITFDYVNTYSGLTSKQSGSITGRAI